MATSRISLVAMKGGDGDDPSKKKHLKSNEKPVVTTELNSEQSQAMAKQLIKSGMRGSGIIGGELQANKNLPFYTTSQQSLKSPIGNKDIDVTVDYRQKLNNWLPEQTSVMLQKAKAKGLLTPESIEANKEYLMGNDEKSNAMRHPLFNQNFPDYWDKFKMLVKSGVNPVPTPSNQMTLVAKK